MTDGLPELVDSAGELLGYEKARALFAEVATEPPDEVLEHLSKAVRELTGDGDLQDDLTLVMLRVKNPATAEESL